MPVQETSLVAFDEVLATWGPKMRDVLDLFRDPSTELCNRMIAERLGRNEHAITSSVLNLRKFGILEHVDTRAYGERMRMFWRRVQGMTLTVDMQGRPTMRRDQVARTLEVEEGRRPEPSGQGVLPL